MHGPEAAGEGGLFVAVVGRRWPLLVVDSMTEAVGRGAGCAVVNGSHGGMSAARFALEAGVALAVFNAAGVGRDAAGIAGLDVLQREGVPACAVRHDSTRIGDARSTWHDGVISYANGAAVALGARPGLAVRAWLLPA